MSAGHIQLPSNPVLYEVYVRSFSDANGDGIGDILGIVSKLDYLQELGIDGVWLTPIFESPQFDFGYDVSNYYAVHDEYGNLADVEVLVRECHDRGIAVILDIILGHTSIEHPWFVTHPDWYVLSRTVPNNWLSVFGGSAWSWDARLGRYYYHRFYKEQPHLSWNNSEVQAAMHRVIQFWINKGVDGFRLDSLDGLVVDSELRDEPLRTARQLGGRENDSWAEYWSLDHKYTTNLPQVVQELSTMTSKFEECAFFVEADLPMQTLQPYVAAGASAFAFDFLRAPLDGNALARIVDGVGSNGSLSWALSNHDQPRLVSRWGRELAGVAATLLLSLPGCSFIYQGDEIGMIDGSGGPIQFDRSGRDSVRHPMQWSHVGGFTTGVPWLPAVDPGECNVSDQRGRPTSMLEMYRSLIRVRKSMSGVVEVLVSDGRRLVFRRGRATVNLNLGESSVDICGAGRVIFSTRELESGSLGPRAAAIVTSLELLAI